MIKNQAGNSSIVLWNTYSNFSAGLIFLGRRIQYELGNFVSLMTSSISLNVNNRSQSLQVDSSGVLVSQRTSVQESIIPLVPEDKSLYCVARKDVGDLQVACWLKSIYISSGMGVDGTGEEKLLVGILQALNQECQKWVFFLPDLS